MNSTEELILNMLERATPVLAIVARKDAGLADQTRRAMRSVALQYAEGTYARGGNRDAKLQGAYAEAKEARMALRVAVATGLVPRERAARTLDDLDHVAAILHLKRTRPL